jgi:hypothetical protein
MMDFAKNYHSLTDTEKETYQVANPEPKNWKGFYEN